MIYRRVTEIEGVKGRVHATEIDESMMCRYFTIWQETGEVEMWAEHDLSEEWASLAEFLAHRSGFRKTKGGGLHERLQELS